MEKTIRVYDDLERSFRNLNINNYNDDFIVGTIFFERDALVVIKKYFVVCGYVLIDKTGADYPVDIRKNEIAILEGTYNSFPGDLKQELIAYNIIKEPDIVWSSFFFEWQFICDWDVFLKHGSFVELCSKVLANNNILGKLVEKKYDLIFPIDYSELCQFTQNVSALFDIELYNKDYTKEINYIIDSLLNGYHINLSDDEIELYCLRISLSVCSKLGEANV